MLVGVFPTLPGGISLDFFNVHPTDSLGYTTYVPDVTREHKRTNTSASENF